MPVALENIAWADKWVGERRRYVFDWTDALADGAAIVGVPTVDLLYGDVELENISFVAPYTTLFIVDGTPGAQAVKLSAVTDDGETPEAVATFRVL